MSGSEEKSKPISAPEPRQRGIVAWMVYNRVTPNLLMIVFLLGGMLSLLNMKKEVFPNFSLDAVFVNMSYPGASPEEVEEGIVLVIEEAVRTLDGVDEVRSSAREGSASIEIEYDPGMNEQKIYQEIQQEIDRIRTFPLDAEEPQVSLSSRRRDVIEVHFYGDVDEWSLRNVVEGVRDRLLQYPAITQVDLEGAREFEVRVEVSMDKLRRYGLTLRDIARIVSQTSVDIPAGGVDTAAGEILVRFREKRDWAREFANIPVVTTAEGAVIYLSDLANVVESFEDSDNANTFNGRRDIGIEVFRVGAESPIEVSRAVRAAMEEIGPTLPAGIEYDINSDRSQIFRQRRDLLLKNAAIGLCLVLLLLGLFLELRLAFWVTMGIPISFLGAMCFMPQLGVSINMISMFAFIIALGIVVDDAIVVGENVFEYRQEGMPPIKAAIEGARAVNTPVVFSILTNNLAFLPILFIPGTFGKIWFVIPIVVISIFTVSLIESLLILPAHLAHLSERPGGWLMSRVHDLQQVIAKMIRKLIYKIYAPILDVAMQLRYLVTACAIALLVVVIAYAMSGRMGMTLMPTVEADFAYAEASLPLGSPIEKAIEIREQLEKAAAEIVEEHGGEQLTEGIVTNIRGERVSTRFYLTPPGVRPLSTTAVVDLWREKVGEIPTAERLRFEADRGGPGRGASATVELAHTSVEVLEAAGTQLATYLEQFPQVKDIDDGYNPGKVQLDFTLKEEGRSLGLSSNEVASQVRALLYGAEGVRQQRGRNEVKVMVNLPEAERTSEYDVEQLMIRTPAGAFVPLRQIAEVSRGRAYNTIERRDGRRTQTVSANVAPPEQTEIILRSLTDELLPSLVRDFPGLNYSFEGRQSDMRDSMRSLGQGFLLAIIGIYFLLAIPFRSYTQPLIVLAALPFGVVGAILGHIVMGYSLSVISVMGIIALGGVVVNDSLVMIDYANGQRAKGLNPYQAMHEAGVRRFRPILLTTMTTFGGLAPMIFETSRQAKFMIPMAISLGYGLLFATAIMLILIPSLYMIREDIISFFTHEETGLPEVPLAHTEA